MPRTEARGSIFDLALATGCVIVFVSLVSMLIVCIVAAVMVVGLMMWNAWTGAIQLFLWMAAW